MTKNGQKIDDHALAVKEEQEHLDSVEQIIKKHIDEQSTELKSIQHEIHDFFAVDLTDVDRKQELRYAEQRKIEEIGLWESYKDSPFFGHLDLTVDDDATNTYLIGETGIGEGTKNYVIDWRNPVGNIIYNKQQRVFYIDDHKYDLRLKRTVDIKHAKLIDVYTEYESSETSLQGEIIDPFLLSVLRDKRRNYKLTDIIRTIQEKQNEIISRPLSENFVLQGCAGSGKTMILLHRLSYLAYNNPNMGFGRVFVLTPSTSFNIQVDELSKRLGLDQIKRYTVEEFYSYLISALARSAVSSASDFKKQWKKLEPPKKLVSEKLLNPALLTLLYSESFYDEVVTEFASLSDYAVQRLRKLGFSALLKKHGHTISEKTVIDLSAYKAYSEAINTILGKHESAVAAVAKKQLELDNARINADDARIAHEAAREAIVAEERALLSRCNTMLSEVVSEQEIVDLEIESLTSSLKEKRNQQTKLAAQIEAIEQSLAEIERRRDSILSVDYIEESEDEVAKIVRNECRDELTKVLDLSEQYRTVPVYNFGRRTRTRNELEAARQALFARAKELVDQYKADNSSKIGLLRSEHAELETSITKITQELSDMKEKQKTLQLRREGISDCKSALSLKDFPDLQKVLKPEEMELLREDVGLYQIAYLQYSTTKEKAYGLGNVVTRISGELAKITADMLDERDYDAIKEASEIVEDFSFDKQYDSLIQKIKKAYKEYGEEYSRNNGYRHMLYLKLLFCSICYKSASRPDLYLNIDEAQDLAIAEYRLLRSLLAEKAIFNLYGDVNQSIYEYKGIDDWGKLDRIIPHSLYVLNENYRNTLEITRYCNQVFEAEVTPVGLSGADVQEVDFEEACKQVFDLERNDPQLRIAIIHKRGVWGVKEEFDYCKKQYNVKNTSIQVLSVEESKGLEFDAVIVLTNDMFENERYIAYTRALDNLFITTSEEVIFDKDIYYSEAEGDEFIDTNPDLPSEPTDVDLLVLGSKYIGAFFKDDTAMQEAFSELSYYAVGSDPLIQLRVAPTYIGVARSDERCRFYVLKAEAKNAKGSYRIKFVNTESEQFNPEKSELYKTEYDNCVEYIKDHPIRLKGK